LKLTGTDRDGFGSDEDGQGSGRTFIPVQAVQRMPRQDTEQFPRGDDASAVMDVIVDA